MRTNTLLGLIAWAMLAVMAQAGPGRVTVTNEAGVVFKDVEVLNTAGDVVTVRTTNGVEFVKLPQIKTAEIKEQPKTAIRSSIFKYEGQTTGKDGHKADFWMTRGLKNGRAITLTIAKITQTDMPMQMLMLSCSGSSPFEVEEHGGLLVLANGKDAKIPFKYDSFKTKVISESDDTVFEGSAIYDITDEIITNLLSAKTLEMRISSEKEAFDLVFPMASIAAAKASLPPVTVSESVMKPTEKNSTWWRWAYQFRVANNTAETKLLEVNIRFLDAQGFIVDESTEHNVRVAGQSSKLVRGAALVDTPISPRIRSMDLKVVPE